MPIILGMHLLLVPTVAVYLRDKSRVLLKGASTLIIVLAALVGATVKGAPVSLFDALIILGLAFGLAGDLVIGVTLLGGMAAFALGHLCYIGALLIVSGNPTFALLIWVLLYAALFFIYKNSKLELGKYETPSKIYAAVILFMLSLSFAVPKLFPAALLFTASDFMLAVYIFGGKNKTLDRVSLWCYFLGQSLFAAGVILGI